MDYIGSKEKVNEWMFSHILKDIDPSKETFLDACSGSGSVSKYAAKVGFGKIISNDIMEFPAHIVRGAISLPKTRLPSCLNFIRMMNELPGVGGFFYKNYSQRAGRLFFTNKNARKIDACRLFIETQTHDPFTRSYLLYCLLEALSSVSNCAGVQAAYLKKFKERALKDLVIKEQPSLHYDGDVKVFTRDILSLLSSQSQERKGLHETISYVDSPYNNRQYGPNYHLYETLVKYDDPIISGKTGLRDWKNESKSDFCSKKTCAPFFKSIVESTVAPTTYVSYNSDGLLTKDEFMDTFQGQGYDIKLYKMPQKRFKADSSTDRQYDQSELWEYLFRIRK